MPKITELLYTLPIITMLNIHQQSGTQMKLFSLVLLIQIRLRLTYAVKKSIAFMPV